MAEKSTLGWLRARAADHECVPRRRWRDIARPALGLALAGGRGSGGLRFALDGLGRVSTSLRFACVRLTVGARGPRDILRFPGHGRLLRRAVVEIEDVRMGPHQAASDGRLLSNGLSPTATT